MFVFKMTPWVRYLEHKTKKVPNVDWYETDIYLKIRKKFEKHFDNELVEHGGALSPLFVYLNEL